MIVDSLKIEANLDTLINEQAYHILSKTDLLDAYKIIQNHDPKARGPLSNVLGMDSSTLRSAIVKFCLFLKKILLKHLFSLVNKYLIYLFFKSKFDVYLSSPDNLIVNQFNMLISPNIR